MLAKCVILTNSTIIRPTVRLRQSAFRCLDSKSLTFPDVHQGRLKTRDWETWESDGIENVSVSVSFWFTEFSCFAISAPFPRCIVVQNMHTTYSFVYNYTTWGKKCTIPLSCNNFVKFGSISIRCGRPIECIFVHFLAYVPDGSNSEASAYFCSYLLNAMPKGLKAKVGMVHSVSG